MLIKKNLKDSKKFKEFIKNYAFKCTFFLVKKCWGHLDSEGVGFE